MISTLFAVERRLNCAFAFIMYSIRDPECDSIKHSTQINGFTCHQLPLTAEET